MKKIGKFMRNPAPFALTIANPARKKRRAKIKLRRRAKNPAAASGTVTRKVGTQKWHHKRGRFLYNPAKKKRRALKPKRRKNPLEIRHVIEDVPAKNPAKKFAMKTRKNRKKRRSRNPVRTSSRGRSARKRYRRNPARRSRSRRGLMRRLRNPAIISDLTDKNTIKLGVGVLVGIGGTSFLLNTLIQGNATTGVRMFDLPGITYSTTGNALNNAQFQQTNKVALGVYRVLIPAVAGWLTKKYDGPLSQGLLAGAIANAGIAILQGTTVGVKANLQAFLPRQRAINTYIPGVAPIFSGPATAYLPVNGSPVARRGTSAVVNQRWHAQTTTGGPDPFAAT